MKDCLVLLTKRYPFDNGEEFIENEVPILAREFEKIILIAVATEDEPQKTRETPENVEVHSIPASKIRSGLPLLAGRLFLSFSLKQRCGADEWGAVSASLKKRAFLAYFSAKAKRITAECTQILQGTNLADYDQVTFYSYWFYDIALAALDLSQSCKARVKKVVSRAHRYDLYEEQNPAGYLPLREHLLKRIDRVYPCSEDGTRRLTRKFPQYAGKIQTAYLGTRDYGLGPAPADNTLQIVSCCHISPVKRVELLAQALALLETSGLSLKWTHFGGGDGLENLKAYAAEHLKFMEYELKGEIKNAELMEYYRSNPVGCFLNTSSSEGLPVSIMEACSFGIPVIATDVGGTAELVHDEENGFLLPEDFTPEELAKRIEQLCRMTPEERNAFRAESRDLWIRDFCSETNYARFAEEIKPES